MIREQGNAAISLVDVARRAGVSRQTLYLQFGSRAGLLLALVDDLDTRSGFPQRMASLRGSMAPRQALPHYVRAWFDYIPTVFPVARALSAAATSGDEDARAAWQSRMQMLRGGYVMMMKGLQASAALRPDWTPERAADWVFSLTHVDTWQHLVVEGQWTPADAADRIVAALQTTLLVPE
ncbi:MAG: hypothetical protein AD742_05125 [Methylibium sp. NZG]|nr:MAG: hypothetical protein AD742_05125 [Methylibium sp. NZG]